jgi:flagellar basal-body rod protein FlgC
MDLDAAMRFASAGMKAQAARMRVTAENLANAESTGLAAGAEAYRRKTIVFGRARDPGSGLELVTVERFGVDPSDQPLRHAPGHPASDTAGYVRMPNVNALVELMDMREAQRSYEAGMSAQLMARAMLERTLELLR